VEPNLSDSVCSSGRFNYHHYTEDIMLHSGEIPHAGQAVEGREFDQWIVPSPHGKWKAKSTTKIEIFVVVQASRNGTKLDKDTTQWGVSRAEECYLPTKVQLPS